MFSESGRIAVVKKLGVVWVSADYAPRMLYRAPILLCATADFAGVRNYAIGVRAIGAIELFNRVQIAKMMTVEHEIVGAAHLSDAVCLKADRMIDGYEEVN